MNSATVVNVSGTVAIFRNSHVHGESLTSRPFSPTAKQRRPRWHKLSCTRPHSSMCTGCGCLIPLNRAGPTCRRLRTETPCHMAAEISCAIRVRSYPVART